MSYIGAGTLSSPIAIDDSEEEVLQELYQDTSHPYPSNVSPQVYTRGRTPIVTAEDFHLLSLNQPVFPEKKRKRANSFTSQNMPVAGPSRSKRPHPSLENRLSQPESKKARKRRRKAERQAMEDSRIQRTNWLNNPSPFAPGVAPPLPPIPPLLSWSNEHPLYGSYMSMYASPEMASDDIYSTMSVRNIFNRAFGFADDVEDNTLYDNNEPHPPSPPPPTTSDWVSSMVMAADPVDVGELRGEPLQWSPLSTQVPLPPLPPTPPPMPPPPPPTMQPPLYVSRLPSSSKPIDHHPLPPKPPPPQPIPPIGMKPDQDPNSKHGIFHITASTREAGSDMKKRNAQYLPNPARTLVMELLPKTHRNPDFINNWSRSACGAHPVHMFIDGHGGKALIEFATAELARKAWSSPKLGRAVAGLKSHQLKGKPREDLIKVWWYRVDGVGAGAGVGEIEEGEIEGDSGEKEQDIPPARETKKERKARLAREREEKRLRRELELRSLNKERQVQQPPASSAKENPNFVAKAPQSIAAPLSNTPIPTSRHFSSASQNSFTYPPPAPAPPPPHCLPHVPAPFPQSWNLPLPIFQPQSNGFNHNAAYGSSMPEGARGGHDDNDSIASSAGRRSVSPVVEPSSKVVIATTYGQGDDLEDYEEIDMDVDVDDAPPPPPPSLPPIPPLIHSSLPPRPNPIISAPIPRSVIQKRPPPPLTPPAASSVFPNTLQPPLPKAIPPALPALCTSELNPVQSPVVQQPSPAPSIAASSSSSSSLASSVSSVPSEPKAMKNAPTQPSFTKRALMARQKELEETIAKSRMELAAATASKASTPVPPKPIQTLPAKPSMDLGEKQAMEDRLRKLVLQSQKARVKPAPTTEPLPPLTPTTPSPANVTPQNESQTTTSTLSISAHSFSLEDMAISFITQTIETIKSQQPLASTPSAPSPPVKSAPAPHSNERLELAAKQKLLEEHISESKSLMAKLSQARTKEEKDSILKVMREKSRLFEEENQASARLGKPNSTAAPAATGTATANGGTSVSRTQSTVQFSRRWPVSQQDAGVLILSDDDDDDDEHDDEYEN